MIYDDSVSHACIVYPERKRSTNFFKIS